MRYLPLDLNLYNSAIYSYIEYSVKVPVLKDVPWRSIGSDRMRELLRGLVHSKSHWFRFASVVLSSRWAITALAY